MISKWYESPNLAGLLRTLTPRSDTTDILRVGVVDIQVIGVRLMYFDGRMMRSSKDIF